MKVELVVSAISAARHLYSILADEVVKVALEALVAAAVAGIQILLACTLGFARLTKNCAVKMFSSPVKLLSC